MYMPIFICTYLYSYAHTYIHMYIPIFLCTYSYTYVPIWLCTVFDAVNLSNVLNLLCQKQICYWVNFHCCKWPNIEQNNLAIWSHWLKIVNSQKLDLWVSSTLVWPTLVKGLCLTAVLWVANHDHLWKVHDFVDHLSPLNVLQDGRLLPQLRWTHSGKLFLPLLLQDQNLFALKLPN